MIRDYMQRVQRILGDQRFVRFNPYDLLEYINEARNFVALEGECVRILAPSTGGISIIQVNAGGSGYTSAPTVSLTGPDTGVGVNATAIAVVAAGAVVDVVPQIIGSGYTVPPSVSFSGGGGSGAKATAFLLPVAQCILGQEVYNFSDFNDLVRSTGMGADEVVDIRSIAVSWGSLKPMLRYFEWGNFQAYLRAYNVGAQGFPRVWSRYQRGTNGSFYLWPIPGQAAQMDLDCICVPQPLQLNSDTDVEAIPRPYRQAVAYKAASMAVEGEPDMRDLGERYEIHYQRRMQFAAAVSIGPLVPDYYNPAAGM